MYWPVTRSPFARLFQSHSDSALRTVLHFVMRYAARLSQLAAQHAALATRPTAHGNYSHNVCLSFSRTITPISCYLLMCPRVWPRYCNIVSV